MCALMLMMSTLAVVSLVSMGSSAQELETPVTAVVLVSRSSAQPSPQAVFTGSAIVSESVAAQDSPDVPIIDAGNTTQSENSVFIDPLDPDVIWFPTDLRLL